MNEKYFRIILNGNIEIKRVNGLIGMKKLGIALYRQSIVHLLSNSKLFLLIIFNNILKFR